MVHTKLCFHNKTFLLYFLEQIQIFNYTIIYKGSQLFIIGGLSSMDNQTALAVQSLIESQNEAVENSGRKLKKVTI